MHNKLDAVAYEIAARDAVWAALPLLIAEIGTGKIVYCTKHGADVFDYSKDELLGKQLSDVLKEDVAAAAVRLIGASRRVCGVKKCGKAFELHVGILETQALGQSVMVMLVVEAYDGQPANAPSPCEGT